MWTKFLNSKWFERIFTSVIAILLLFLTQKIADISTKKRSIEDELKTKASFEYVDKTARETYEYINKQDENIVRSMNQHMRDQVTNDKQLMDYIKSMDSKINILIQRSKE